MKKFRWEDSEVEADNMLAEAIEAGILEEDIEEKAEMTCREIIKKKVYNTEALRLKIEIVEEICADYKLGKSVQEIAWHWRVSEPTIRLILKENE